MSDAYTNPILARAFAKKVPPKKMEIELDKHYNSIRRDVIGVTENKWNLIINGDAGMGKTVICKK